MDNGYIDFAFHWGKKNAKNKTCKVPELILNFMVVVPLSSRRICIHTKVSEDNSLKPLQTFQHTVGFSITSNKTNKPMPTRKCTTGALSNSRLKQRPPYTGACPLTSGSVPPSFYCIIKCQMPSFSGEKEVLNQSKTSHCKGKCILR